MSDLVKNLRIVAGMIEMGEPIKFGSDSGLMLEAAKQIEADTALLNQIFTDLHASGSTPAFGSVSLNTFGKIMQRLEGGAE